MIEITLSRVAGDYGFEAKDQQGHVIKTDSSISNGGADFGARPMQLLLIALGGCTGIDVVSILKKQRQVIEGLDMTIKGEREAGKEPSLWQNVHIHFELAGQLDEEKVKKACTLSIDKYCSVAETLRRGGATITWDVQVRSNVMPAG
ncbi:MAG TPA: OsmC family protein [Chitinophagaceae bacterium]|jgi:putative redox protein|nr:OsmC family protein [Chitinophagaceae bacterium]